MRLLARVIVACCMLAAIGSCGGKGDPPPAQQQPQPQPQPQPKSATTQPATPPATPASTRAVATLAERVADSPPWQFFPKADEDVLEEYGGIFIPTGEGPIVRIVPVDGVMFGHGRGKNRILTDDDMVVLFPVIQRMDPYRLYLTGHAISDDAVDLLNRLRSLRVLDVSGTKMTRDGLLRLRIKTLMNLSVPAGQLTDADREELRRAMPKVKIHEE